LQLRGESQTKERRNEKEHWLQNDQRANNTNGKVRTGKSKGQRKVKCAWTDRFWKLYVGDSAGMLL